MNEGIRILVLTIVIVYKAVDSSVKVFSKYRLERFAVL